MVRKEPSLLNQKSQKQVIFSMQRKGNCSEVWFPRTRVPQYSILRESA
jgi:hypothetical protein